MTKFNALLAIFAFVGCTTESGDAPRIAPNLYEWQEVIYSHAGSTWYGLWNLKIRDGENYQRIYYGGNSPGGMTKNVVVEGKYAVEPDTGPMSDQKLVLRDSRILQIKLAGCGDWKDTNSVVQYPIRNIDPNAGHEEAFEIYGRLDIWGVPDSLRDYPVQTPEWMSISDYRDSTSWPVDIRRCGMP